MLNEVKSGSDGKNQNVLITVLLIVIFSGVSFFAGTKYQQKRSPFQRNQIVGQFSDRGNGGGTGRQAGFRGGQIMGDIINADDKSITVKLADGSSKIILVSSTTSINKAAEATIADLKVGEKVAAFGTANSDGSVTAQNIQLNPIIRERPNNITVIPTK